MKSQLTLVGILLCTLTNCIAQNLTGIWTGVLTQAEQSFPFELEFIKTSPNSYNCISTIKNGNDYGIFRTEGEFIGTSLLFNEIKLIDNKNLNNNWCFKNGRLRYSTNSKKEVLSGNWKGNCVPGTIRLTKIKITGCTTKAPLKPSTTTPLIINGDFEQGYYGFKTDYKIAQKPGAEQFLIVRDAKTFNQVYYTGKGKGCFLAVDGSTTKRKLIWGQQKVFSNPENLYEFSFKLSNLKTNPEPKYNCLLEVKANNLIIGKASCPIEKNKWESFSFKFTPNEDTINFQITNISKNLYGNDIGLDNISLKKLSKKAKQKEVKKEALIGLKIKKIDEQFSFLETDTAPGAIIAIVKNNQVVYKKAFGMANLEHRIPIKSHSVFDAGSVSKQFTGYTISLLIERGKLNLDDNIRNHIPELPDFGDTITIRNLLHHNSGLRDWSGLLAMKRKYYEDRISYEEILELSTQITDLSFKPGEQFKYCNMGYVLLTEIVHRVTGETFRDWTDKHIFAPLKMNNTHFRDVQSEVFKNKANGYFLRNGKYHVQDNNLTSIGSSCLYTTMDDYIKWANNFHTTIIESPSVINRMISETTPTSIKDENHQYGFGLGVSKYKGINTVIHFGRWGAQNSSSAYYPDHNTSIIIFSNRMEFNHDKMFKEVFNTWFKEELIIEKEKPEKKLTPKNITGIYYAQHLGFVIEFKNINDSLEVHYEWTKAKNKLTKAGPNSWKDPKLQGASNIFNFINIEDGKAQNLTIGSENPTVWKRLPTLDFPNVNLKDFVGSFWNNEISALYTFSIEDGELIAKHERTGTVQFQQIGEDKFLSRGNAWFFREIQFKRDSNGKVIGLEVTNSNITAFPFKKVNNLN